MNFWHNYRGFCSETLGEGLNIRFQIRFGFEVLFANSAYEAERTCLYRGVHIQEKASCGRKYFSPCRCSTRTRQVSRGHRADQHPVNPKAKKQPKSSRKKVLEKDLCIM